LEGTVKRWLDKGYGFIEVEGKEDDIFVHHTDITETFQLKEGQKVKFDLEDSQKGPRATNVEILE
jgi:CspA family cold shock protein